MKNIKNVIVVVVILVIGFLGMSILSSSDQQTQKRDTKPPVRAVKTQFLEFKDVNLEILGNGVIESKSILDVVSEVSGKIDFAKNNLKNGTFVEKGETIVQVDSREIENDLYSLRSDFVNSVASLLPDLRVESDNLYSKWFEYFSKIDIHKRIPELPEVSNLQEKIKLSSRQIFTKYYKVRNQEILLSKYIVNAPFTGFIKSNGLFENSFISRGQHLFTLEDVYNLEIAVPLLVDEFNQIDFSRSKDVEISSDNTTKKLTGKIIRKSPILDRNSQSLNVYVGFSNYDMVPEFLSGNYVNVKIFGRELNNVAAVPRHLLDSESYVYTIEEGKLAREKLNILEVQKEDVLVANDFNKEMEIISTILQKPLIGMPVRSLNNPTEIDSLKTQNDSASIAVNDKNL